MQPSAISPRCLVLALALVACASTLNGPARAADAVSSANPGKFTLTCLNLPDIQRGCGLALVMQTPGGRTILYDTGNGYPSATAPDGWFAGHNDGRDVIDPFLKQRGVSELDGVVISHAHYDHFGGFIWLMDHYPIRKLFDPGYELPGRAAGDWNGELGHWAKLRQQFQARPGVYQEAHTGDTLAWDDRLEVEVLAPPKTFFGDPHPERRPKNDPPEHYLPNANALALRIRHGKMVFVLGGDIESDDQKQSLLPSLAPGKLKCDVLVAPGHGIHATAEFAEAARPKIVVASVFARYAKGVPSHKVYGAVGAKVYCTGLNGNVEIVSDGEKVTARPDKE